ncbi:MAG TPA: hypothetical protein DDZ84_05750 [Firmicutes bacterium]|nr:hypothetical protein [Bacillota bacterium]
MAPKVLPKNSVDLEIEASKRRFTEMNNEGPEAAEATAVIAGTESIRPDSPELFVLPAPAGPMRYRLT